MRIVLVVDGYGEENNGTTMTAKRLAATLLAHGHEVRILSGEAQSVISSHQAKNSCADDSGELSEEIPTEQLYATGVNHLPVLYQVCKSQGMSIARADREVIRKAVTGADLVHFLMPFHLSRVTKRMCDRLQIPTTAAFHVQPENITSTLHLGKSEPANRALYDAFRHFYNKFQRIHCPSEMIAQQLREHGYQARLYVVSNGVVPFFHRIACEREKRFQNRFVILMVGRLSAEKRQDLILEAVRASRYERQIQIVFAGKGPWKAHLEHLAKGMTNPVSFGFYSQEELRRLICSADLYIHASDAEIEAISCMEAFSCGLVPVISDSPLTATKQFALREENLFAAGNAASLCDRIEYWMEHPAEKEQCSQAYVTYARQYALENCVARLEEMFREELAEHMSADRVSADRVSTDPMSDQHRSAGKS